MPNIAYGRANELTPGGNRWDDIMNEDTKKLELEHFLYSYLILKYAKEELGYKSGANDFRVNSAFLFIATYYLFFTNLVNKHIGTHYETADEIDIGILKEIFKNENINKQLLMFTNRTLKSFFREYTVKEARQDNLRGFVQNKMKKGSEYWKILESNIEFSIGDFQSENKNAYEELKNIIINNGKVKIKDE